MCRNRSNRCENRNDNVLGDSGTQEIALRGPGCISGTGQCEGVMGTGGRRCAEVLGTGGRRCAEVLGTGNRKRPYNCCEYCCDWLSDALTTPTTVPR
ncbi:MAG: hypothetical protein ACERLG_13240 [Sedimentibacter sp.]